MRIGLQELDPHIAEQMADRLAAPLPLFLKDNINWSAWNPFTSFSWEFHSGGLKIKNKRQPSEDEKRSMEIRKKREEQFGLRVAFGAVLAPVAAGGTLFAGVHALAGNAAGLLTGAATWAAGLTVGVWYANRATPKARLNRLVQVEEMRAAFPLLTLTRAERVYCDTVLLLARLEMPLETEKQMRETLRLINDLVGSSRQLEQRRLSLVPLLGNNVVPELEREHGELGRRLDQAKDVITRQSLQQSLEMCATRLENAKTLDQGLERLKAQQEAIVQTISSVQSAILRLQVAPDIPNDVAAEQISDTITQMNQQTYAVEQAVQEVLTLRVQ